MLRSPPLNCRARLSKYKNANGTFTVAFGNNLVTLCMSISGRTPQGFSIKNSKARHKVKRSKSQEREVSTP